MPKLKKAEVRAKYLDPSDNLNVVTIPVDKPIDPGFTNTNIKFATSASGYFTVEGSIYFNNSQRIRLCHANRPKISSAKSGLVQYCLRKNGELFYKDFQDLLDNASLVNALNNMNAIVNPPAPLSGVLCEFWGTTGRHISRGQVINVTLSQFQVNLLYIGGVMESNSLMRRCWLTAQLPYS